MCACLLGPAHPYSHVHMRFSAVRLQDFVLSRRKIVRLDARVEIVKPPRVVSQRMERCVLNSQIVALRLVFAGRVQMMFMVVLKHNHGFQQHQIAYSDVDWLWGFKTFVLMDIAVLQKVTAI
eukprot:Pompholyxophrys_punicea_v1_NODE_4_length_9023_cov_16.536240.p2 type:complete len:122 gc:universal NODE_4_length_9023_cov_16.536240:1401-1036(-)